MNTVMTMEEANESIRQMRQVFDIVLLLDAGTVRKINENKKHPEDSDPCFAFWKKNHPCENCVSYRALEAKGKKVKMEFVDSVLYQVVAKYVEIDGKAYIMEMINCLDDDDDVMLDSDGRDRLLRKLSGYEDELYIDALTGISNRRYFEDQVRQMKISAGIAMIDLDDFKIYNDTFGHGVGDVVLKTAAKAIRKSIHKSDILIRYGGDEFLLVMPDISAEVFTKRLKQIRKNINEVKVPGYPQIRLTVSIGGALSSGDEIEDAIARADSYMYQAKLRKNMVVTENTASSENHEEQENGRFRQKILIVDDSEFNRAILTEVLGKEFDILEAKNGKEGLKILEEYEKDISLVLLDIVMPVMDGFEVLNEMVSRNLIDDIPVIIISSEDSETIIRQAYDLGAADYINRPFDAQVVYRRVYNTIKLYAKQRRLIQLVTDQVYEKQKNNQIMIGILSQIMGYRNGESGQHILRINLITDILLDELARKTDKYDLSWPHRSVITTASALHDIGKIGISETILNKREDLTAEETQIMNTHTLIGATLMKNLESYQNEELVKTAYQICRWHHERYDGSGYPDGLKGEEIPIAAQVVALADAYDILVSDRKNKKAVSPKEAIRNIREGKNGVFNPILVECLVESQSRIQRELENRIGSEMKFDCCPKASNLVEKRKTTENNV